MLLKFLSLLIIILIINCLQAVPSASAFVIGEEAKEVLKPDVSSDSNCSISSQVPNGDTAICSGVLVLHTWVMTAGHCMDALNAQTKISCGYLGEDRHHHPRFAEIHHVKTVRADQNFKGDPHDGQDIALIELAEASKLAPIKTVDARTIANDFFNGDTLKSSVKCQIAGFGISPKGAFSGTLFRASMDNLKLTQTPNHQNAYITFTKPIPKTECSLENIKGLGQDDLNKILEFAAKHGIVKSTEMPGDSGGALYCRQTEASEWTLIGITSGGGVVDRNGIVAINTWSIADKNIRFPKVKSFPIPSRSAGQNYPTWRYSSGIQSSN
jgi:secreted trypsin-like serine protease